MTKILKRVLVVDDEDDLTWSISKHLAKDKDKYELICVNSGKKALEVLSQLPIELVISDIRMPEISGMELLGKIKESYPTTKVIIMTAYGSSEVQEEANKRGCLKYIEKPFEINELRQLILSVIEEKKGFQGTISDFQLHDLVQMNCLGRMTAVLYIVREKNKGEIYFYEGNIIHAECNGSEGKDALYEMLTWEGGNFSTERGKTPPKETIFEGWQSLLLEGMRRVDESKPSYQHKLEQERNVRLQKIDLILNKIVGVKGVILAAVFDTEGFPHASKINEKSSLQYSIKEIALVFSNLIKQVETVGNDLNLDNAIDISIDFENNALLKITKIPEKQDYLIILSGNMVNPGVIHLEVKKQIRELSKVL
jgi:CheY-like chemotaxis protein/predicted regulator of Ras-like GTPase activity (Roadblock/LC7/MglB family)